MGMDLDNDHGDYFRFGTAAWDKMMCLAKMYGWQPAGTEEPDAFRDPERRPPGYIGWNGSYIANAGQAVMAEDASALADALEKALADLPDCEIPDQFVAVSLASARSPLARWLANLNQEEGDNGIVAMGPNESLSPIEFFGGANKGKIIAFVDYCRLGRFQIW